MPSALLLAAVQLLKMNAKLTAALPPPCFLLHLIARFKFHPESLGKQRIPPLQKLQQGLFFSVLILYGCYNFPMMFPRSWLPCRQVRWLEQVGQKFLLASAMMLLAVSGPRHNYLVLGISLVSTHLPHFPDTSFSQDLHVLFGRPFLSGTHLSAPALPSGNQASPAQKACV